MPGKESNDVIFLAWQLQEKFPEKRRHYFFMDLDKAFNRVPREAVWWALKKLGGLKKADESGNDNG